MSRSQVEAAHILIVDDQPENVALLRRIVGASGFSNVTSTTDPREAVRLIQTTDPDILLLDLQMPHLDGFDVMRALAHDDQAQYLPVLVLTADLSPDTKRAALAGGAKDFLVKPFDPTEVLLRIKNLLETRFLHLELSEHNKLLESRVQERTAQLWDSVQRLEASESEVFRSREETIRRLSIAAEFRDDETARHIVRMSNYSAFLAGLAGLDQRSTDMILVASQMHDIGKLGTPDSVLLKPGPLTADERLIMQKHAEHGWQILHGSGSGLLDLAATIARSHHERVDGTGYPDRLMGEEIPLVGRIAAIADVFDALSSNRVYRRAFPLPDVWQMLREGKGTHFDGDLLDLFFDSMDEVLAIKQANDDQAQDIA